MLSSNQSLNVAVIFGGRSAEHEVSLTSARAIIRALTQGSGRHQVVPIVVTKEGDFLTSDHLWQALEQCEGYRPLPSDIPGARPVIVDLQRGVFCKLENGELRALAVDVVFPALHGPGGEDGTIQGLLEVMQLPYVGSKVAASAVGMDKLLMKAVFKAHGLPQVPYLELSQHMYKKARADLHAKVSAEIGFPCFVKPVNMGSSIGISKVKNEDDLPNAICSALKFDPKVLIEKAAESIVEVECAVLGNTILGDDEPLTSILGQIVPCNEFYDYEAKYLKQGSELVIPAPLSASMQERVRALARQAFLAIGARGLSRVDFFVSKDTEEVWVNEINTMPGFTPISMYPKLWEASGVPFEALVGKLVALALEAKRETLLPPRART